MSVERAKALTLTALYLAGFTWIHDAKTDIYRVLRPRDARDGEVPLITSAEELPDTDQIVTYDLALLHADPEVVARALRSFMPATSRIIPSMLTQSAWVTDSAHNILKMRKLVGYLDTPEGARGSLALMERYRRDAAEDCPPEPVSVQPSQPALMIALFSLIALVIGFLARGYVIRRIEGGL